MVPEESETAPGPPRSPAERVSPLNELAPALFSVRVPPEMSVSPPGVKRPVSVMVPLATSTAATVTGEERVTLPFDDQVPPPDRAVAEVNDSVLAV